MASSHIEWTELTWNPSTGCTRISDGCRHCYAEILSKRLQAMGLAKYENGFKVTIHPETLSLPYEWKKGKMIFVNSMSDLFHHDIPFSFIESVFKVMNENPQHIFQVLTKRSDRLLEVSGSLNWTPNIWMGVSVENEKVMNRIEHLRQVPAIIRFLSAEPLIGPLPNLDLTGISWVIAGGESGPGARQMEESWAIDIRNACQEQKVSFFFKQWGGVRKKRNGRILEGRTWDQFPVLAGV